MRRRITWSWLAGLVVGATVVPAAAAAQAGSVNRTATHPRLAAAFESPGLRRWDVLGMAAARGRRVTAIQPSIPVGLAPQSAAEDYTTHTLYIANSGDNTVSVVNLATCSSGRLSGCAQASPTIGVGTLPLGVAVDEATDTVYVANAVDNTVSVINGATCNAIDDAGCGQTPAAVAVGAFGNAVAVDPVTNMVFVTDQDATPGTVSVIDGNSCTGNDPGGCAGQPFATVTAGGGASAIGVNSVTNTIYVANTAENSNNVPVPDGDTLTVINGATCSPSDPAGCDAVGTVPVGTDPAAVAIDPATNTVYAANTGDNSIQEGTVSVVDGSACDGSNPSGCAAQEAPQVTVGADPVSVAIDPNNQSVYVANLQRQHRLGDRR